MSGELHNLGAAGFRGLKVWQKGMDATDQVYAVTRGFPRAEVLGLTSQLRRAASSVPMNIAEGYRRKSRKQDYLRFLRYADGSAAEVETAVEIAARQKFMSVDVASGMIESFQEIGRMLGGLIASVEREAQQERRENAQEEE